MSLSAELVSEFVKVTNDRTKAQSDDIRYGTVRIHDGKTYVELDGAKGLLTPFSSTADVVEGERVMVRLKQHTAVITGNVSSPAARTDSVKDVDKKVDNTNSKIDEFGTIVAYNVTTDTLNAVKATISTLTATIGKFTSLSADDLVAIEAAIETLNADYANLKQITAEDIEALNASVENFEATFAEIKNLSTEDITAVNAEIEKLKVYNGDFTYVSADVLEAAKAKIDSAAIKYANIDFSNIGKAAMEYFYSKSGLIENVTVGDQTITGSLVGVTITGDLIQGNTIMADKLVIRGEDGLFYKLNIDETERVTKGEAQTEYNSLNGSIITAKSITATQISVSDLVAFNATIAGFSITDDAIFSDVKDSAGNTTRGIHLGKDGQVNFGDADNYIRYVKDENGEYHLTISAEDIQFAIGNGKKSLSELGTLGEYVKIGTYSYESTDDDGNTINMTEPCIELGESDSSFKLIITNTRILFTEDSNVPAYISNQSLHITKAVVEEELTQGQFKWKIRNNGNLALMWVGVSE